MKPRFPNPKAGMLLAEGWSACVFGLFGDQDYKRDCLKLPNVNSVNCCAHCPANNSSVPWFDFRRNALWPASIYSREQWLSTQWCTCELFAITGVSIFSIYPDWMHDKHLGTDKVFNSLCLRPLALSPFVFAKSFVASLGGYVLIFFAFLLSHVFCSAVGFRVLSITCVGLQRCCMAACCGCWCTLSWQATLQPIWQSYGTCSRRRTTPTKCHSRTDSET